MFATPRCIIPTFATPTFTTPSRAPPMFAVRNKCVAHPRRPGTDSRKSAATCPPRRSIVGRILGTITRVASPRAAYPRTRAENRPTVTPMRGATRTSAAATRRMGTTRTSRIRVARTRRTHVARIRRIRATRIRRIRAARIRRTHIARIRRTHTARIRRIRAAVTRHRALRAVTLRRIRRVAAAHRAAAAGAVAAAADRTKADVPLSNGTLSPKSKGGAKAPPFSLQKRGATYRLFDKEPHPV